MVRRNSYLLQLGFITLNKHEHAALREMTGKCHIYAKTRRELLVETFGGHLSSTYKVLGVCGNA
jgi:hypothetical protein